MNKTAAFIILMTAIIGGVIAYELFNNETIDPAPANTNILDSLAEIDDSEGDLPVSDAEETMPDTPRVINTNTELTANIITNPNTMTQVTIMTNKGDITVELFENDAPNTTENFLKLTRDGFYDGVIFHRVISGFMIQGGDPTGTGTGGPGYKFDDELDASTESYQRGYVRGTLAMANAGPNTNGSQFFIMHADYALPNAYTIFGRVVEGMEVVDAIATSEVDGRDKPRADVVMESVRVVE